MSTKEPTSIADGAMGKTTEATKPAGIADAAMKDAKTKGPGALSQPRNLRSVRKKALDQEGWLVNTPLRYLSTETQKQRDPQPGDVVTDIPEVDLKKWVKLGFVSPNYIEADEG